MRPPTVTENLRSLIKRSQYLHAEHEQKGFHLGRQRDFEATAWALEELRKVFPDEFRDAEYEAGPAMRPQHVQHRERQ